MSACRAPSHSDFIRVRSLRYHVRRWGDPRRPILFLAHGLLDASATFADLATPLTAFCRSVSSERVGS